MLAVVTDETRRIGDPLLDQLEQRYRRRNDALDHLDPLAAASACGAPTSSRCRRFAARRRRPSWPHHLERRTWSWLWAVPPDVWAAEVEPVIAALRAGPDPTSPGLTRTPTSSPSGMASASSVRDRAAK